MTGLAGKDSQTEATAEFREPANSESTQLALLGVEGIRVTPLELAVAYRWLALQLAARPDSQASRVVSAAMENSASFGMARQAGGAECPSPAKPEQLKAACPLNHMAGSQAWRPLKSRRSF